MALRAKCTTVGSPRASGRARDDTHLVSRRRRREDFVMISELAGRTLRCENLEFWTFVARGKSAFHPKRWWPRRSGAMPPRPGVGSRSSRQAIRSPPMAPTPPSTCAAYADFTEAMQQKLRREISGPIV
jgi:hypothetical protein